MPSASDLGGVGAAGAGKAPHGDSIGGGRQRSVRNRGFLRGWPVDSKSDHSSEGLGDRRLSSGVTPTEERSLPTQTSDLDQPGTSSPLPPAPSFLLDPTA